MPATQIEQVVAAQSPMFVTVLSVNKLAEDITPEQRDKLNYEGPFYVDWDGPDIAIVLPKVHAFMDKLEALKFDLTQAAWYLTGQKGFHLEIPAACFMEKLPKTGVPNLPVVYKEMVFEHYVDTIDMRVYSQGRGRMWRQPNVKRPNGRFKVQVTPTELRALDATKYALITSERRDTLPLTPASLCVDLAVSFARAQQKVEERLKARGKRKRDPQAKERAACPSVKMMMSNIGVKPGVGFHELALQISIAANTAGQTEEQMLADCSLLIEAHQGNGDRYNSPAKRREELLRMYRYTADNPCYDFSVGAIKVLLTHTAPDLDGITSSEEDVKEGIKEAEELAAGRDPEDKAPDEFNDVAGGVTISKFGVYVPSEEGGKKRICAVSFKDIHLLISTDTGQLAAYEAEVMVNGRPTGRQTIEMETFQSLQMFNRFCARLGHAMQGTEPHMRGLFMRFIELAKKKGRQLYIAKREGLDIFNIPNHEDEALREPFMVWADGKGVVLDPRVRDKDLEISFQGFPDPRGLFKTDLADAPKLRTWLEEGDNKEQLRSTLKNMLTCQKPDVIAKMVGWYTACFYRMIFHKAYGKFPLLHVNGAAGSGKCLGVDTPVLMADGSIKKVQDVAVGDRLLGPDGSIRNVLSLARGRDQMYRVSQNKGDSYIVNSAHNLSLRLRGAKALTLADGTRLSGNFVKVNVKTYLESRTAHARLKGWRPEAVEFFHTMKSLPLDPYWLGAWIGDGRSNEPTLCKPACNMTRWWQKHAEAKGCSVRMIHSGTCETWAISGSGGKGGNPFRNALQALNLIRNKHIPPAYKVASVEDRLALLAGLIDSDGNVNNAGYRWASADKNLAEDVVFIARSVGIAATLGIRTAYHKQLGREYTMYEVYLTGAVRKIPCLDKLAERRLTPCNPLIHGIHVEALGEADYYGFQLDGDHLFLLGDFTPTFNTEMNYTMAHLFFFNQEPKMLTPQSTPFAIQQHLSGSVSVPLLLDEYKPHEMSIDLHNKLKLMFRDAYNCRDITKGGGNRESDDYRSLTHTQLCAPMAFIAEAAEDEAAVAERVVLVTIVKPSSSMSLTWLARFQQWNRNRKHLAILGQYLASEAIQSTTIDSLRKEFDVIFEEARNKFMLTEADLKANLSEKELSDKQSAKERSVYNFTVARFGLMRFKRLVDGIFGPVAFADLFHDLDAAVYARMADLTPSTQAEWAKVMDAFAAMSYSLDADSPMALRPNREYAHGQLNGRNTIELNMNGCYLKYRSHMRSTGSKPLFGGVQSFLHSIKDSPALIESGMGKELQQPGVYIFDADELAKLRVGAFKS